MTDQHRDRSDGSLIGRLDLSALDAAAEHRRTELAMAAVMMRVSLGTTQSAAVAQDLVRLRVGMAAAAVLLAVLATGLVLRDRPQAGEISVAEMLEGWVQSNHVPTNGELLTAYQGYRP